MYSEYNDLVNCYANANSMTQLVKCDKLATDFTKKYGSQQLASGLSLASVLPQATGSVNIPMIVLSVVLMAAAISSGVYLFKRAKSQSQKGQVYRKLDAKRDMKASILPQVDEEVAVSIQ